MSVNTGVGTSGVTAGSDGYVSAVNPNTAGSLKISGFDTAGKGPGTNLQICIVNWNGTAAGTANLSLAVDSLTDEAYNNIGTLRGVGATVTIN